MSTEKLQKQGNTRDWGTPPPFKQTPWNRLCRATGVAPCRGVGVAERSPRSLGVCNSQSACLRRNAGISRSSMPPEDNAFTRSVAWVRPVRHTLGTAMLP